MSFVFKVGDRAEVVDTGQYFSTYQVWADKHGLAMYKDGVTSPKYGSVGVVIGVGPHCSHPEDYDGELVGVRIDGTDYIYARRGLKLLTQDNGVDADGKPYEMTLKKLKPFQRVVTSNGVQWIVGETEVGYKFLIGKYCWASACINDGNSISPDYDIVEVYEAPECYAEFLKHDAHGKLVWKRNSEEDNKLKERIAYFETHIAAVEENLESLRAEYEKLVAEVN